MVVMNVAMNEWKENFIAHLFESRLVSSLICCAQNGYEYKLGNKVKLKSRYRWKTNTKLENRKYNWKVGKLTENLTEKMANAETDNQWVNSV